MVGSWDVLSSIKRENSRTEDVITRRGPIACPYCGNVLVRFKGVLNCPTGDFRVKG